jgi:type II secretory pathway pseudopilin PulG
MRRRYRIACEHGFILTELLVAMATSGLLLGAVVSSLIAQQKSYDRQAQIAAMTLNARTAIDWISRELRTAGYGVPRRRLAEWVDWVRDASGKPVAVTNPVQIAPGESGQDVLILVGCFDPPIATLRGLPIPFVSRNLDLRYTHAGKRLNTKSRNILYIGRNEHALVTALKRRGRGGERVQIDTNLRKAGHQPLSGRYLDTQTDRLPVERLGVVTYRIEIDRKHYDRPTPVLKRDENTGGGAQPLAEYIETLNLSRDEHTVTISLTARTPEPDPVYRHPTAHDGYRRLTLTSTVRLRNRHP